MIQKGSIRAKMLGGLAAVASIAAACSNSGASTAPSSGASAAASGGATGSYTIGFANGGGVGNGWREALICSVKAQAVKSGNVTKVTVIHHDTDAAGQLTDIRDLIAKGVNAIIINPTDPDALNPAIAEAIKAGIKVVADRRLRDRPGRLQPVERPGAVRLPRRQVRCSSRWARRATSSTCAASPATRPTPTATRASRRRSPRIPTSRSPRKS